MENTFFPLISMLYWELICIMIMLGLKFTSLETITSLLHPVFYIISSTIILLGYITQKYHQQKFVKLTLFV